MAIYPDRKDAMSGLFSKTAQAVGRNGLSSRLLSSILVCSTVLAMIITALQLAWDYRKDVAVIEDSIGQEKAPLFELEDATARVAAARAAGDARRRSRRR